MREGEKVLCFPGKLLDNLGMFRGVLQGSAMKPYVQEILKPENLSYIDRTQAENDPSWKQLIPYCVLLRGFNVFRYQRTPKGGESRLHGKWSLGVGGHINPEDGQPGERAYAQAFQRELLEEVHLPDSTYSSIMGLIYDQSDAVGRVHFGIVHFIQVGSGALEFHDPALGLGHFDTPGNVRQDIELFENWSKLIAKELI